MHDATASEPSRQASPFRSEKPALKAWVEPELTGISVLSTQSGSPDGTNDGATSGSVYS